MPEPIKSSEPPIPADRAKLFDLLVSELYDFVVFLVDRKGRLASWNPAVEKHLGYREDEFVGREGCMIFTPEDNASGYPQSELKNAVKHGRAADTRWHLGKGGKRIFVEGTLVALRDEEGKLLGFAKVMRNITERKLNEDRLQQLTEALNLAPVMMCSPAGIIEFWSRGCERLYGFAQEEAIGKRSHDLLRTEFPAPLEEIEADLAEHCTWRGELRQRRRDGSLVTVLSEWVVHRSQQNAAHSVIQAGVDITAQKHIEQALQAALGSASRANQELSDFSHIVSHDLQAPVRAVRSYTQLLARRYQGKLDNSADEFIRFILDGAERMDGLIRTLLKYAQTSDEPLRKDRVNVADVMDAVLANLELAIRESRAKITCGPLPAVDADPVQLGQVFQNLVANAIKYRRPEEPPHIQVSAERQGGPWLFLVEDNGIGIAPEFFDRVFQPLRRLHGQEIPGTGMGLAVCKKIVERHGGRIWVESEEGKGARFYFTLPA